MQGGAIAIIPARGGSERVPRKNLVRVAGLPLIAHTIRHARQAAGVAETYVSTDDDEIATVAREYGAEVVRRPPALAGAQSTSEEALVHVLDERRGRGKDDPELVVFLQATSPVRSSGDVDAAIRTLVEENADSVFSAAPDHRLLWRVEADAPRPLNWELGRRPRSQELDGQWLENGSIYVFRPQVLREHGNRLGGKIALYPMEYWSSFELDSADDARLLEWILTSVRPPEARWPERIALVAFDFDGVMTDNSVSVGAGGVETVHVSRGDGWGIARLREAGMPMIVLSTEAHPVVGERCAKLGLECRQGLADKAAALRALLDERSIPASQVAYVGNDVNDLGCFELVGFPVAVADAEPALKTHAALVLSREGGRGAVRELCDLLLARSVEGTERH
jgi:YrbI family 3-deoxy-D-manno-octulosonate 8-phosphate phosphatase